MSDRTAYPPARSLVEALEFRVLLSAGGNAEQGVSVMTQNLYIGADLLPAIGALTTGDPGLIVAAVTQTFAKVGATDFAARAAAIAKQVKAERPDLIGLQEAALWRSGQFDGAATPATHVEYDFVQILVDALAAEGLAYTAVVTAEGIDAEAPGFTDPSDPTSFRDIRFTDRDVILARADAKTSELKLSNPAVGHFDTNLTLPFPGGVFTAPRGWVQVDAKVRGESFRFVSTHLESVSDLIRQAQAAELVAGLAGSPLPTVLVGDFNATPTGPDSGAYGIVTAAGFVDAWALTHPGEDGFTWGQAELLDNPVSTADQRIDHLFTRGALFAADVTLVGDDPADRTPSGLWPSDHAGVVGDLVLARRPAQTGFAFSTAAIGKTKLRPEAVWA